MGRVRNRAFHIRGAGADGSLETEVNCSWKILAIFSLSVATSPSLFKSMDMLDFTAANDFA